MNTFFETVTQQFVIWLPRTFWAIVILAVLWFTSYWIGQVIRRLGPRMGTHVVVADFMAQVVATSVLILGIVCALGTLGVDVTALVAGLGLAGFAVGFALKDILSNIVSGILLMYYQPFGIYDRIKVSGQEGVVSDINLRYTIVDNTDGAQSLIPNAALFTNIVQVLERKNPELTIDDEGAKTVKTADLKTERTELPNQN